MYSLVRLNEKKQRELLKDEGRFDKERAGKQTYNNGEVSGPATKTTNEQWKRALVDWNKVDWFFIGITVTKSDNWPR